MGVTSFNSDTRRAVHLFIRVIRAIRGLNLTTDDTDSTDDLFCLLGGSTLKNLQVFHSRRTRAKTNELCLFQFAADEVALVVLRENHAVRQRRLNPAAAAQNLSSRERLESGR
jgi:hypothetical protein